MKTPCLLFISAAIIALGAPAAAQVALPNAPIATSSLIYAAPATISGWSWAQADAAGRAGMEPSMTWYNTG